MNARYLCVLLCVLSLCAGDHHTYHVVSLKNQCLNFLAYTTVPDEDALPTWYRQQIGYVRNKRTLEDGLNRLRTSVGKHKQQGVLAVIHALMCGAHFGMTSLRLSNSELHCVIHRLIQLNLSSENKCKIFSACMATMTLRPDNTAELMAHACMYDHRLMPVMLDYGFQADRIIPECVCHRGQTPLHIAVRHGQTDALRILLQHGCNPDVINENVATPLHQAVVLNRYECARLLVSHGAQIYVSSARGYTPYGLAHGKPRFQALFRQPRRFLDLQSQASDQLYRYAQTGEYAVKRQRKK